MESWKDNAAVQQCLLPWCGHWLGFTATVTMLTVWIYRFYLNTTYLPCLFLTFLTIHIHVFYKKNQVKYKYIVVFGKKNYVSNNNSFWKKKRKHF